MSNIYNRRLDYEVLPTGKRVLQEPTKTVVPKYAIIGNTKPNLDFQVNRMLQPLFATKQPIPQSPYTPKQPVSASGLGGKKPYYIDFVSKPMSNFKTKPPKGLVYEPNSIRELRQNVYPDGLPKNNIAGQQADSQYLEDLNNQKKQKQLEERYNQRVRVNNPGGGRPHPNRDIEEELKKLDDMLAETKYGKGAYKNIALNAEGHAKLAQKQAEDIRAELNKLRAESRVHKSDVVSAIQETGVVSSETPKEFVLGDPEESKDPAEKRAIDDANKYIMDLEEKAKKAKKDTFEFDKDKPIQRVNLMKNLLISNGLTSDEADFQAIKLFNSGDIARITAISKWKQLARIYSLPTRVKEMKEQFKEYEKEVKAGSPKIELIVPASTPKSGKSISKPRKGST